MQYHIYIIDSKGHGLRTRPASLTVEAGDQVTWHNHLVEEVEMVFAEASNVFGSSLESPKLIGSEGSHSSTVRGDPAPKEYKYHVRTNGTIKRYADGDSDPKIIVLTP